MENLLQFIPLKKLILEVNLQMKKCKSIKNCLLCIIIENKQKMILLKKIKEIKKIL